MCWIAEHIDELYFIGEAGTNVRFEEMIPVTFKPGIADRFVFNKILDSVIDTAYNELHDEKQSLSINTGMNIMAKFYYPQYGEWKNRVNVLSYGMDNLLVILSNFTRPNLYFCE